MKIFKIDLDDKLELFSDDQSKFDNKPPLFELDPDECHISDVHKVNGKFYVISRINLERTIAQVREIKIIEDVDDIKDTYESELTCPVCGYQNDCSFELSDEDDNYECGRCGSILSYTRQVSVDYDVSLVERCKVIEHD